MGRKLKLKKNAITSPISWNTNQNAIICFDFLDCWSCLSVNRAGVHRVLSPPYLPSGACCSHPVRLIWWWAFLSMSDITNPFYWLPHPKKIFFRKYICSFCADWNFTIDFLSLRLFIRVKLNEVQVQEQTNYLICWFCRLGANLNTYIEIHLTLTAANWDWQLSGPWITATEYQVEQHNPRTAMYKLQSEYASMKFPYKIEFFRWCLDIIEAINLNECNKFLGRDGKSYLDFQ